MNNASPIIITRIINHTPDRVFEAFSSAEAMAQWLSPSANIHMSVEQFDFVVEGAYDYIFTVPNQGDLRLSGRFLEIKPPHRLSFSWRWHDPDPHADIDSHVLVEVFADPAGTRLSLTHSRLDTDGMYQRHSAGWDGSLGRLETHLSTVQRI